MKKWKGITLTGAQRATLLTAFTVLLLGGVLLAFGAGALFLPLRMAGLLHLAVGTLLLLGFLWPLLHGHVAAGRARAAEALEAQEKKKRGVAFARLAQRMRADFLRWSNLIALVASLVLLAVFAYLLVVISLDAQALGLLSYLHVLVTVAAFLVLLILSKALQHFMPKEWQM
jgi:hypothetical protein